MRWRRVGTHEVYWHRPLAAYHCPDSDKPVVLSDAPLGYLTAYPTAAAADAEMVFRSALRVSAAAG